MNLVDVFVTNCFARLALVGNALSFGDFLQRDFDQRPGSGRRLVQVGVQRGIVLITVSAVCAVDFKGAEITDKLGKVVWALAVYRRGCLGERGKLLLTKASRCDWPGIRPVMFRWFRLSRRL